MLLFVIFVLLILSALEDVRYLSAPQMYLYLALALGAVYGLQRAHYALVFFVVLALLWAYRYIPGWSLVLLVVYPPVWPLVILGAGMREAIVGDGDLLTAATVSFLSPWAALGSLVGLLLFWRLQKRRRALWYPAIPGVLMGALPFLIR